MSQPSSTEQAMLRRQRARRTAWIMGAIALVIYAGFILSGVLAA